MTRDECRGKDDDVALGEVWVWVVVISSFFSNQVTWRLSYVRHWVDELLRCSSLMLETLFPRSRVAKQNKKEYAPENLFQNVGALSFPFWVVLQLYHKFQVHVLHSQFLTHFGASQNKDSPNQVSLVRKLHPGSKLGTSGSSTGFFLGHQDNHDRITASME